MDIFDRTFTPLLNKKRRLERKIRQTRNPLDLEALREALALLVEALSKLEESPHEDLDYLPPMPPPQKRGFSFRTIATNG